MANRSFAPLPFSESEAIQRLKHDLWDARCAIVGLAPDEAVEILQSYPRDKGREALTKWEREAIAAIAALAEPDPELSHFGDRGWCPLCRCGSLGPYQQGFTLPIGLTRHLEGSGNVRSCDVMNAAFALARDACRVAIQDEERADDERTAMRRRQERLFRVDPHEAPLLQDERLWGRRTRTDEEMAAAEDRLRALGFSAETSGNVTSWRLQHGRHLVWADPRAAGIIEFRVVPEIRPRRGRAQYAVFNLQDSWKNSIVEKFQNRLAAAAAQLTPQPKPAAVADPRRQP